MNVLNYDSSDFLSLVLGRIKELISDSFPSEAAGSGTAFFLDKVFERKIFDKCSGTLALSTSEQKVWNMMKEIEVGMKNSKSSPEPFISKLQDIAREIQHEDRYWMPVFYTITMLTLAYVFFDLERGKYMGRDKNIDRLSRRQTIGEMFPVLSEINKTHSERLKHALDSMIKKGRIQIVEEFVMAYKYYYIDLDGHKYSNYNSEDSRNKAVNSYINKLCDEYDKCSLAQSINIITFYRKDYSVL